MPVSNLVLFSRAFGRKPIERGGRMNNTRRALLKRAVSALEMAASYVNSALDQEQDCLDDLPENLAGGERYGKMETAIEKLGEAIENIDGAKACIEEASE